MPASAPVSDLFVETLREDRGAYQNGKLWVPIETRTEKLGWSDARGQVATMDFEVRSTRHGPLIESLWDPDGAMRRAEAENDPRRASRALAWTGARAGTASLQC